MSPAVRLLITYLNMKRKTETEAITMMNEKLDPIFFKFAPLAIIMTQKRRRETGTPRERRYRRY